MMLDFYNIGKIGAKIGTYHKGVVTKMHKCSVETQGLIYVLFHNNANTSFQNFSTFSHEKNLMTFCEDKHYKSNFSLNKHDLKGN